MNIRPKANVEFRVIDTAEMPPLVITRSENDNPKVVINTYHRIWISLHRRTIAGVIEALQEKMDVILDSYLEEQLQYEKNGQGGIIMAGITKECKICKGMFSTRSLKSASWENTCHDCYSQNRRTHFEKRDAKKVVNIEAALQRQIDTLHAKVSDVDMLIAAEISNHFNNITEADMLNKMTDSVLELVAEKVSVMEEQLKSFQEKIQKQLVAMNNRMISMFNDLND